MRILVTADLHYDVSRSREPVRLLARQVCATGGDAVALVGDTAGADTGQLVECLRLFDEFPGRKFLVAGNHCLWCRPGEDSMHRYRHVLPAVAAEAGFHLLDEAPAYIGDIAFVGSVGWYDYSFRDESLGIPEPFYRAKIAPGAARYLGGHEDLLAAHRHELTDAQMDLGARWMDGRHVRLGVSDEQFLDMVAQALQEHLRMAAEGSGRSACSSTTRPLRPWFPRAGRRALHSRPRTWAPSGWASSSRAARRSPTCFAATATGRRRSLSAASTWSM